MIAEEEPNFAAAVNVNNASGRAAFAKFIGQIGGYNRAAGEFDEFHYETTWAMNDFFGDASEEWQESEEGERYQDWNNVWDKISSISRNFKLPLELTDPKPLISDAIAALPHDPS